MGGAGDAVLSHQPLLYLQQHFLTGTMSTVVAQALHVFGLRSYVANNVFFFDEQIIIFPSGNHCVKYNVDQKWQKFIPGKKKGGKKKPSHPVTYVKGCATQNHAVSTIRKVFLDNWIYM